METVKRLFEIFSFKQKLQFVGLFIILLLGSLLELLGVSLILPFAQMLLDPEKIFSNEKVEKILTTLGIHETSMVLFLLVCTLIFVYIFKNIYLIWMKYIQAQIMNHNQFKLEVKMMEYYVRQPYSYHVKKNVSEINRTILTDVSAVFVVLTSVFTIISNGITSVMLVALLLATDFSITVITVVILSCFVWLYFKLFRRRIYQYGKLGQRYGAEVTQCLLQSFAGIKELKVNQCEQYFINQFANRRILQISMVKRGTFVQQIPKYVLEMVTVGGVLSVIAYKLFVDADISMLIPQLAVFAAAAFKLLPSVSQLTSDAVYIYKNKPSIDLIYMALDEVENGENGENGENKAGTATEICGGELQPAIEFHQVSFSYDDTQEKVLDHVDISIMEGESVAFIGSSGAGKTTTVDLILGLLLPTGGMITYGGISIEQLGSEWKKKLGYIPQNIYLSDSTIRENVAFGVESIDDAKVWRALEEAQLKDFVENLADGLNARVGDRGVRISGGQRQRIGIARALYNEPEILILDEATSALDNETEKAVMESIDFLKRKKTLIIVAHRLSTIQGCDRVFRVENRKIRLMDQ